MKKIFLVCLFFGISCSPGSIDEFRLEGEWIAKSILERLQKVESLSDLVKEGPRLKKEFALLVKVMIEAKKYRFENPEEEAPMPIRLEVSEALKQEFIRVYQFEGCAEVMEGLQRESLHRLDYHLTRSEALKS